MHQLQLAEGSEGGFDVEGLRGGIADIMKRDRHFFKPFLDEQLQDDEGTLRLLLLLLLLPRVGLLLLLLGWQLLFLLLLLLMYLDLLVLRYLSVPLQPTMPSARISEAARTGGEGLGDRRFSRSGTCSCLWDANSMKAAAAATTLTG